MAAPQRQRPARPAPSSASSTTRPASSPATAPTSSPPASSRPTDGGRTWQPVAGPRAPVVAGRRLPRRADRRRWPAPGTAWRRPPRQGLRPGRRGHARRPRPARRAARRRARPSRSGRAGWCCSATTSRRHALGLRRPEAAGRGAGQPGTSTPSTASASTSGSSAGPARSCCTAPTAARPGSVQQHRPAAAAARRLLPRREARLGRRRAGHDPRPPTDGGKTWKVQRRGGQRAAVLFVHARPRACRSTRWPCLGGDDGYLTAGAARDRRRTRRRRAPARRRRAAAAWPRRCARPAARPARSLWQFPLPQHLARRRQGRRSLDGLGPAPRRPGRRAAAAPARPGPAHLAARGRRHRPPRRAGDRPPAEALVAEAVHEAFAQAADPKAFPEQIEQLGLEPWKPTKLYACWHGPGRRPGRARRRRVRAAAGGDRRATSPPPPPGCSADGPPLPTRRSYRLLADRARRAPPRTAT